MRSLSVFLTVLFVLSATATAQTNPIPEELDRIVAVVNNDIITLKELRDRMAIARNQLRQQKVPMPPPEHLERQVLERMIVDKVQLQFAEETALRVDDATLERALANIAQSNRMMLSEFRAALESDGIPWSKFREDIRDEITIARLREREVDSRVTVSEGEVDNFLASAESSGAHEEFDVSHVLLRAPEQASPEQLQSLRARAEEVRSRAAAGADFAQLAASYSDAPDALSGGSLGWRPPEKLPTLFVETVVKMQPGEISKVLRSPAGFHVIKLNQRRGSAITANPVQQTHARHILIKTSEVVSETEAKRRLVELKERLDNGADFAELARAHSNDLSAGKGGDLGWVSPGDTVPDFERVMNALKPGEISEPIRSPFGWHLIQVMERRMDASPERRRQAARQILRDRKADEAYQDWLRQMRDRAYVELRLEEH